MADDFYLMYYGPRNHFDIKNCDIRLAVYKPVQQIGIIRLFNKEQVEAIKQGLYGIQIRRTK